MNLLLKTCIAVVALMTGTEVFGEPHQTFIFKQFRAVSTDSANNAVHTRENHFCQKRYDTCTVYINKDPDTIDVAQFPSISSNYLPMSKNTDESESIPNDFISEIHNLINLTVNDNHATLMLSGGDTFHCESRASASS